MTTKMTKAQAETFERFWRDYPRKIGKGAARRAWAGALRIADAAKITAALERQLKAGVFSDIKFSETKFIPYPATWLNQERWEDEVVRLPTPAEVAARTKAPAAETEERLLREALADALETGDGDLEARVRAEAAAAGISLEAGARPRRADAGCAKPEMCALVLSLCVGGMLLVALAAAVYTAGAEALEWAEAGGGEGAGLSVIAGLLALVCLGVAWLLAWREVDHGTE